MITAKIALILIVGLIALFSGIMGILSDYTTFDDKFKSVLSSPTSYVLSMRGELKSVEFSASLSSSADWNIPFSFTTLIPSIVLDYEDSDTDFEINSLSMTSPGKNKVSLYNYRGRAIIKNEITLDGSTEKAIVNSVEIKNPDRRMSVDTTNLEYDFLELTGLPSVSLTLYNVSGNIISQGENYDITYKLQNQKLEIAGFKGTLRIINDQLMLDGVGIIKTETLLAPSS